MQVFFIICISVFPLEIDFTREGTQFKAEKGHKDTENSRLSNENFNKNYENISSNTTGVTYGAGTA